MSHNDLTSKKTYISEKVIGYAILIISSILMSFFILFDNTIIQLTPVMVLIFVLFIFTTLKFPIFGLLFYATFFLVRPQEFVGILMSLPIPLERMMSIFLIFVIIFKVKSGSYLKLKLSPIHYSLSFFVLVAGLSVVFSIWISGSYGIWYKLLHVFIAFFIISLIIVKEKHLKYFMFFIILSTAFHAITATVNYYRGIVVYAQGIERAYALDLSYGDPNSLATTIVITLPLYYYFFKSAKSKMLRISLILIAAVSIWCIILTGSRGGMMGVIAVTMLIIWQSRQKILYFLISIITILLIWSIMPGQYQKRFESITNLDPTVQNDAGAARSASARVEGIVLGVKMVVDRPILGYGIGQFGLASYTFYNPTWWGGAHTIIGQILGEVGLLGTFAFILWLTTLFKSISWINKKINSANDLFLYNMSQALKDQLLLLMFLGLGGHNMLRFNWYITAALVVVILNIVKEKSRFIDKVDENQSFVLEKK